MSPHQDKSKLNRGVRGFTLVEALVALTLLTVGLIPAFRQASDSIILAGLVRNSLIANNLAQEGAEVVRSLRDANWFTGNQFSTGLDSCTTGCAVEFDSTALLGSAFAAAPLKLDPQTGLYQYATGADTVFRRQVIITPVGDHELVVIVRIQWPERSGQRTHEIEYHLYDWLQ
jgi:Tfp pilus assembly protein PilX